MEVKFTFKEITEIVNYKSISSFNLCISAEYPCLPPKGCIISLSDQPAYIFTKNCMKYSKFLKEQVDEEVSNKFSEAVTDLNIAEEWWRVEEIFSAKEGEFIVVLS